jgi:hypothetical protein
MMRSRLYVLRVAALLVAALASLSLAACDGGGPPPMVLNDPNYVPPSFTTVDICGGSEQTVRMQKIAHGTFAGANGGAAEGVIVVDDAHKNWAVGNDFNVIGPAERMPDGNWKVTPQPGAKPTVSGAFPCPPPSTRPMETTPSGSQG